MYRYTGQQSDADSALYYCRARYYEPSTGRFITQDPMKGIESDPSSYNLYLYCDNNPIRYTDPSGLFWTTSNLEKNYPNIRTIVGNVLATLDRRIKAHCTSEQVRDFCRRLKKRIGAYRGTTTGSNASEIIIGYGGKEHRDWAGFYKRGAGEDKVYYTPYAGIDPDVLAKVFLHELIHYDRDQMEKLDPTLTKLTKAQHEDYAEKQVKAIYNIPSPPPLPPPPSLPSSPNSYYKVTQ